ncbi:MAG: hypothetical protein HeimC2_40030 [Candidatus Heimdallarchaeota archaeon LC_2]|nr:MAG: hypothetical protein HeimC2_40030 [Candidatus Heimdallarchaeota archaeon LC_2]
MSKKKSTKTLETQRSIEELETHHFTLVPYAISTKIEESYLKKVATEKIKLSKDEKTVAPFGRNYIKNGYSELKLQSKFTKLSSKEYTYEKEICKLQVYELYGEEKVNLKHRDIEYIVSKQHKTWFLILDVSNIRDFSEQSVMNVIIFIGSIKSNLKKIRMILSLLSKFVSGVEIKNFELSDLVLDELKNQKLSTQTRIKFEVVDGGALLKAETWNIILKKHKFPAEGGTRGM